MVAVPLVWVLAAPLSAAPTLTVEEALALAFPSCAVVDAQICGDGFEFNRFTVCAKQGRRWCV